MEQWYLTSIPKILNAFWSKTPMSYLRFLTLKSFAVKNPDWEIRLYTPKSSVGVNRTWKTTEHSIPYTGFDYNKWLDTIKNLKVSEVDFEEVDDKSDIFKSDILRWQLLSTHGGFWTDMDIVYISPMNDLYFNKPENSKLTTIYCRPVIHPYENCPVIGFMGASADNEFYGKHLNIALQRLFDANPNYQKFGAETQIVVHNEIKNNEQFKNTSINFMPEVVYPFVYENIDALFFKNNLRIDMNTIGIHWFGGKTKSAPQANAINHESYKTIDSEMCRYLRKLL